MAMALPGVFIDSTTAATFALQIAILVRMYKTGLWRELRMFFAYTMFCVFRTALLIPLRNYAGDSSSLYLSMYALSMIGDTALAFLVIQEVYAGVLHKYEGLRTLSIMIFRWAFMLLVLLAVVIAFAVPATDSNPLMAFFTVFERSAMIVELGLVGLLFVLARALSLGWRECVFGVAAGLCLFSSLDLAALTLRAHYGASVAIAYDAFKSLAYMATVSIWTVYIYRDSRTRDQELVPLRNDTLDTWNAVVQQFLNR